MNTIYIDMDGVVADFDTHARTLMNLTEEEMTQALINSRYPDDKWRMILNYPNFFRALPLMPRARELMCLAHRFETELGYNLRMLTAIPKDNDFPEVFQDKMDWMREHFPGVRVHFGPYSEDKQHHCKPMDILVDDRPSNMTEWRNKGGVGIHVTHDYQKALDELNHLLNHLIKARA
jgi:5'(3')-deoxyribonucleotidase